MKHFRKYVGRRVVVQLDSVVWAGTLVHAGRDEIELTGATAGIATPLAADGRIVIPELQVQFVQVLD